MAKEKEEKKRTPNRRSGVPSEPKGSSGTHARAGNGNKPAGDSVPRNLPKKGEITPRRRSLADLAAKTNKGETTPKRVHSVGAAAAAVLTPRRARSVEVVTPRRKAEVSHPRPVEERRDTLVRVTETLDHAIEHLRRSTPGGGQNVARMRSRTPVKRNRRSSTSSSSSSSSPSPSRGRKSKAKKRKNKEKSKSRKRSKSKKDARKKSKRRTPTPSSSSSSSSSESEEDDSSSYEYHISFESSSSEEERPVVRRKKPEIGKGKGSKGKSLGRGPGPSRSNERKRKRTPSPTQFDSDAEWEAMHVAKGRSLLTALQDRKNRQFQRECEAPPSVPTGAAAPTTDTPTTDVVDIPALQRALALAEATYDLGEKLGEPVNQSMANIVDGALR